MNAFKTVLHMLVNAAATHFTDQPFIPMWLRWTNLRVSPRYIVAPPQILSKKSSLLKLPCIHKYVFVGCKAREATNPSF